MASKKNKKKPMPLESLPEHLKTLKERGETGGSTVVNTGQIVTTTTTSITWLERIGFALVICMVLTTGIATYHAMSPKNITVIVDIDNPQKFSQIVSEGGGEVISMEQREDSTYEVQVSTRKNSNWFLEWLRQSKEVKKAELED